MAFGEKGITHSVCTVLTLSTGPLSPVFFETLASSSFTRPLGCRHLLLPNCLESQQSLFACGLHQSQEKVGPEIEGVCWAREVRRVFFFGGKVQEGDEIDGEEKKK